MHVTCVFTLRKEKYFVNIETRNQTLSRYNNYTHPARLTSRTKLSSYSSQKIRSEGSASEVAVAAVILS